MYKQRYSKLQLRLSDTEKELIKREVNKRGKDIIEYIMELFEQNSKERERLQDPESVLRSALQYVRKSWTLQESTKQVVINEFITSLKNKLDYVSDWKIDTPARIEGVHTTWGTFHIAIYYMNKPMALLQVANGHLSTTYMDILLTGGLDYKYLEDENKTIRDVLKIQPPEEEKIKKTLTSYPIKGLIISKQQQYRVGTNIILRKQNGVNKKYEFWSGMDYKQPCMVSAEEIIEYANSMGLYVLDI